jgi:hypothetical protein
MGGFDRFWRGALGRRPRPQRQGRAPSRAAPGRGGPAFQHSLQHALLGELGRRGHRGGRILLHRSIWGLQLPPGRLWQSSALALGLTALLLLAREAIGLAWSGELLWWMQAMALPGRYQLSEAMVAQASMPWQIVVPQVQLSLTAPLDLTLAANAGAVALLWWAAAKLPDAFRPGMYLLRLCALIHGCSVAFFWLWPAAFPHSVQEHLANGLQQCWSLMLLAPWIHLGTFYLFSVGWRQRLALTLLTWAYLFVLAPLLYALHALVISACGLLAMPLLHLMGGVIAVIVGFVALYGWAMSWANQRSLRLLEGR